jgi:hypothetical protein
VEKGEPSRWLEQAIPRTLSPFLAQGVGIVNLNQFCP